MNPLHLIWIIPLFTCFGYFVAVLMMISRETKGESEAITERQGDESLT